MQVTLVILEEGNHPLQCCPKCDMFFTWQVLNENHQAMEMCARGMMRRLKQLPEEEARLSTTVAFEAYGIPLWTVKVFKYPVRILTASEDDWPEVIFKTEEGTEILGTAISDNQAGGGGPQTAGIFYKAVVQENLLLDTDTWVISPRIGKTLGGFHHMVTRQLVVMRPRWDTTGRWV